MPEPLAIETRGLSYRFGSHAAVQALDLQVPKGCICGFLGPNGAGKTTTIRLLLGLLKPGSGSVLIEGRPLGLDAERVPRRIGALIEAPSLYANLTGRKNLEVLRRLLDLDRGSIAEALRIAGLEEDADRLVRAYSLGMRQRLGLAGALLGYPEILILDEPANGLDPAGVHAFRELVRSLVKERGTTVFLSSHLLAEVELVADRVAILNRGRLLFQGSLAELQTQRGRVLAIRVDRSDDAAGLLQRTGWRVGARQDGILSVEITKDEDAAQINALLAGAGLAIYHLAQEQASLEQYFLGMMQRSESHV